MSWQPPTQTPPPGYGGPSGYPPYPQYPGYPGGPQGFVPGALGPAPGLEYASFPRRLGGYLIDGLIFLVPLAVLFFIIYGSTLSAWATQVNNAANAGLPTPNLVLSTGGLVTLGLIDAVASFLYYGVLVASWGSTVGQRAVGVRVVREEDASSRLPLERALARSAIWWGPAILSFVPIISDLTFLVVLLALLWVIWDPRNQGLHDKLGRALVVKLSFVAMSLPPAYPYLAGSPYPGPSGPSPAPYPPGPTAYPPGPYTPQ